MGRYLSALKQNLGYTFPLFALTATAVWNPKGGNDMVFETIRSLQMEPCVLYVGTVKRKNIGLISGSLRWRREKLTTKENSVSYPNVWKTFSTDIKHCSTIPLQVA